mgnify:CR=1 FL=1
MTDDFLFDDANFTWSFARNLSQLFKTEETIVRNARLLTVLRIGNFL